MPPGGASASSVPPGPAGEAGDAIDAQRFLIVHLDSQRYAIPLSAVADVAACGPVRPVPRSPEWVLGLAERRGRVVTVLDLARLLGRASSPGPRCLVRLAWPLDHLALSVPAAPRHLSLASLPSEEETLEGVGAPPVLLDPSGLLATAKPGARAVAPCG